MTAAQDAHIGNRLVVLGQDAAGMADFRSDETCGAAELAGQLVSAHFLGGADQPPALREAADDALCSAEPPAGGWRCSTLTLQPDSDSAYFDFIGRALGPLADAIRPGFHVTPTLDLILIVAGDFELASDTGDCRRLRAGDVVQIHSACHRWRNVGAGAATLFCVQIGAARPPISKE